MVKPCWRACAPVSTACSSPANGCAVDGRVGVLTVAAPAAFAVWWLVPRLGRFAALHPEIEVRIAAIDGREPDLWRDGIDVAVVKRAAKAAGGNTDAMPLLHELVFPVCAPSLLGEARSLR